MKMSVNDLSSVDEDLLKSELSYIILIAIFFGTVPYCNTEHRGSGYIMDHLSFDAGFL